MRAWLLLLLCCLCGAARADTCSATLSNVSFGNVSPLSGSDIYASASGSVSCSWTLLAPTPPFLLLFPNVAVCVNIGLGSNSSSTAPRTLGNGANRLQYNLYSNASYAAAAIAGSPATPATPTPLYVSMTAPNLLTGGTVVKPFTVYARIPAGAALASVPTVGNADTVYSSSFAGAASITYAFYNLIAPSCTAGASASFSFQVSANVVNDCTISANPLDFGTRGVLTGTVRATGALAVRCVNNNAYQIKLNGGSVAGNISARKMKPPSGTERITYQLSETLDGPVWGDGTGGSTVHAGTGNGNTNNVTVYGRVPAQTTPTPGNYRDTITATVYF